MPGLVSDESDYEDGAMQPEDSCFFCKNSSHIKRNGWKFMKWVVRNPEKFA